jgi:hypothetical protein
MDPQVQASFIPKKSLDVSAPRGGGFGGLLFLIALLIFIASIVAAGGVFAYKQYLQNSLTSKANQLKLAEGAYDPGTIQDLIRLDSRLTQADILLGKHVAVSNLFAFLSNQTLANVSFSSFNYTLADDGSATIVLQGSADSFSTVALQSDQFNNNKLLKDVVFSSIAVDATGHVNFSVTAKVAASVLSYSASLNSAGATTNSTSSPQATQ